MSTAISCTQPSPDARTLTSHAAADDFVSPRSVPVSVPRTLTTWLPSALRGHVRMIDRQVWFTNRVSQAGQQEAVASWSAADEPDDWIGDRPAQMLVIREAVEPEHAIVVHQAIGQIDGLAIE